MKNWRYNTETGFYYPVSKTEHLTVAFNDDWNDYGFQLEEAPQYVSGGGVSVVQYITGGASWIEDPVSATSPAAGHFMVDYDAPGYEGTGRIRFNSADNGKTFTVSYLGLGRVITPAVISAILPGGIYHRSQVFTSNGTFTVPDSVTRLYAVVVGAGGGGAGGPNSAFDTKIPSAGGGGGVAEKLLSTTPGSIYAVIVGIGGTGGASDTDGTNGGQSSFGSIIATGGGKGTFADAGLSLLPVGGASGVGSGGDLNYGLGDGDAYLNQIGGARGGGAGGSGDSGPRNGKAPGAGGSGGSNRPPYTTPSGGNGANGIVIVYY